MNKGFTLIELMITLVVAAILLTVGVPSFRNLIQDNRLVTQTNELVVSLNLARSEALKRGTNVAICRSSNSTACTGNWQDGWIVFTDTNDDGVVDAGEQILRVHGPLAGGTTLAYSSATNRVRYDSRGLAFGHAGTYELCDSRGATSARGVIVSPPGRPRTAEDTNSDGTREDGSGNNFTCP